MEHIKSVSIQYLPNPEEVDGNKQLKAGKFLFPGFAHTFVVKATELPGGNFKYVTGLEADKASDSMKEEIVEAKKELEKHYGEGMLEPTNELFWKNIRLTINKTTTFLDINRNMEHKLLYYVIKGGGLPEVAPTYESAVSADQPNRWFLVEPEQMADLSAENDKFYDRAIAGLVDLDNSKTFDDMLLVHKALVTSDRGVTRQTPKSALYKDLSEFIKGKIVKTDKRRTPKQFIETVELLKKDKKKLYITAYVKDALYFNYIIINPDNQYQNLETKTKYGSNTDTTIQKLSNPAFQDELENIKLKVERKWSE